MSYRLFGAQEWIIVIKFHFETLRVYTIVYRLFIKDYIRRYFPALIGLFLTGKAGARIKSEIRQTDVGTLHDLCSLCFLVNVEEQQWGDGSYKWDNLLLVKVTQVVLLLSETSH